MVHPGYLTQMCPEHRGQRNTGYTQSCLFPEAQVQGGIPGFLCILACAYYICCVSQGGKELQVSFPTNWFLCYMDFDGGFPLLFTLLPWQALICGEVTTLPVAERCLLSFDVKAFSTCLSGFTAGGNTPLKFLIRL